MTALRQGKGANADAEDDAALALAAALLTVRLGEAGIADNVLEEVARYRNLMAIPAIAEFHVVLRAQRARLLGRPQQALELLQPLLASGHERYQTRVALQQAYADAGDVAAAQEQAHWLQRRRGLAYIEFECGYCLQALNVVDSHIGADGSIR